MLLEAMLGEPVHVLWPCARALEAGEDGRSAALEAVDQHQGDRVAVEIEQVTAGSPMATDMLHPKTNEWYKQSKSLIELTVGLHQSSVAGAKSTNTYTQSKSQANGYVISLL